jgi:hypothetical protein
MRTTKGGPCQGNQCKHLLVYPFAPDWTFCEPMTNRIRG